jgi:hypothetical protein
MNELTLAISQPIRPVLTGHLDDETAGLWAIKRAGSIVMVQGPTEAEAPDMPTNAMNAVTVDHCVPIGDNPGRLTTLTQLPAGEVTESAANLGGIPVLGMTFTSRRRGNRSLSIPRWPRVHHYKPARHPYRRS